MTKTPYYLLVWSEGHRGGVWEGVEEGWKSLEHRSSFYLNGGL